MPRPKAPGTVIYLGRVRLIPDRHSPELEQFVTAFAAAGQPEKLAMLQRLLDGRTDAPASYLPPMGEDQATADLLDNLLGGL